MDDAEIVLVGYGIVGRILKAVAAEARAAGIPVGLLRPITLYPFPVSQFRNAAARAQVFAVVEMSLGQMVDDVRLAVNGRRPVEFLGRCGRQCAIPRRSDGVRSLAGPAKPPRAGAGEGGNGQCLRN